MNYKSGLQSRKITAKTPRAPRKTKPMVIHSLVILISIRFQVQALGLLHQGGGVVSLPSLFAVSAFLGVLAVKVLFFVLNAF
jgi:hypothetical protein